MAGMGIAAAMPKAKPAAISFGGGDNDDDLEDLHVDGAEGSGSVIEIDAKTGHVKELKPDGSMSVRPIGDKRKPKGARNFNDNLAEEMDELELAMIANRVLEGIENDLQSRSGWERTCEKAVDLIGCQLEEATADITADGMISKIKYTGLMKACIYSWANGRAELLPVNGPVKVRDDETNDDEAPDMAIGLGHNGGPPLDGPDGGMGIAQPMQQALGANGASPTAPGGKVTKRNELAEALEKDFNHYLTVVDKEYYPDFSRMLLSRALLGVQFRKVYRDPILKRPVSRWVKGVDLILSNDATTLDSAKRVTERILMGQGTVRRLMAIGHWRDIALVIPTTQNTGMEKKVGQAQGVNPASQLPADQQHTIYETTTDLDDGILSRDETGREMRFPLPYRVTIDKDSRRVVEIRRRWKRGDADFRRRRMYVKYGFVPGLGFYDWGFVHMIGNPQRGVTMLQRCLTDCGMLNSMPGGIIAKSPMSRTRTTQIRPSIGEFIVLDTGGQDPSKWVMPWPYKEPSPVLQSLANDLAKQMDEVAGVVNLPVGEGRLGNTPVATIMTYIETISKVPSAVHKDDHISQQDEYDLMKELFAEDPESLWKFARRPNRKWQVEKELMDQDLVPASDPNVPSQTHRMMMASTLVQASGLPQFNGIANQRPVYETFLRTSGWTNTGEYTIPPPAPGTPPPPNPELEKEKIKQEGTLTVANTKAQAEVAKEAQKTQQQEIDSADRDAERKSQERRALLGAHVKLTEVKAKDDQHGRGIQWDATRHGDEMHHKHASLSQDHLHHTNDHIAQAADRAADQAAQQAEGDGGIATDTKPVA